MSWLWRLMPSPAVVAIFGLTDKTITNLIDAVGYPIVGIFVAVESSGIPFPGETALVLAAVYAGTAGKHFSIFWVIVSAAIGAIGGKQHRLQCGPLRRQAHHRQVRTLRPAEAGASGPS